MSDGYLTVSKPARNEISHKKIKYFNMKQREYKIKMTHKYTRGPTNSKVRATLLKDKQKYRKKSLEIASFRERVMCGSYRLHTVLNTKHYYTTSTKSVISTASNPQQQSEIQR